MYGHRSGFTKWLIIIALCIFWPVALFVILVAIVMAVASG